jgi:hypothetical protein
VDDAVSWRPLAGVPGAYALHTLAVGSISDAGIGSCNILEAVSTYAGAVSSILKNMLGSRPSPALRLQSEGLGAKLLDLEE